MLLWAIQMGIHHRSLAKLLGCLDRLVFPLKSWMELMRIPKLMSFVHPLPPLLLSGEEWWLMIDIVFMTEFGGVNSTRITDYTALKEMGNEKVKNLVNALSTSAGEKSCTAKATMSFWILSLAIGILLLEL